MAEETHTYVTLRHANFNMHYASKYGNKSPKGAVLFVPVEVAEQWQAVGIARPSSEAESKDYKDWIKHRFDDDMYQNAGEEEEEAPEPLGTPAQRRAQQDMDIRNHPAPQRPTAEQVGNMREPKDKETEK